MARANDSKYYVFALRAAADVTGTILIPAIIASLLGRALDAKLGTERIFFVGLLVGSALLTVGLMVRKIRAYGEAYNRLIETPPHDSPRS